MLADPLSLSRPEATKMVDEYKQARQDAFVERDRLASEARGFWDLGERHPCCAQESEAVAADLPAG